MLVVIYLVHALSRRLPDGVKVFSFNPGFVPGTGLASRRRRGQPLRLPACHASDDPYPYARSMKISGADLATVALNPRNCPSGSYLNGTAMESSSPESYDTDREEAVLGYLAAMTATTPAESVA
jgi:hypothetical protein